MVDRIAAHPGTKTYGRISVMVQYYCQVEKLFTVKPTAFNPPPKVDSAIIYLKPYVEPPFKAEDEKKLGLVVREAFNQRRKTISNSLKEYVSAEQLAAIGIDPKTRPEQLSVEEFVKIANMYEKV
jgi:16S rRNA (adenine1518-N6/adenine1519-N6)-dimethyltransferase